MCSLSKEQSIISRETIQNTFFRIMHLFRLKTLYPACVLLLRMALIIDLLQDELAFSNTSVMYTSTSELRALRPPVHHIPYSTVQTPLTPYPALRNNTFCGELMGRAV